MAIAPKEHSKKQLRKSLLARRRALPTLEWQVKSYKLCHHLKTFPRFAKAQTLCAYRSFQQEPDLSTLWETFPTKRWGLPRCEGQMLIWHEWSPLGQQPLQINRFQIEEPYPNWPLIIPSQVEVILVPTVACDRQGYRLGYGGGFYDRLFEAPDWQQVLKIGIVFQEFIVETLPRDPWDIPLDAIASDQGILPLNLPNLR